MSNVVECQVGWSAGSKSVSKTKGQYFDIC